MWGICISHLVFESALNRDGFFVLVFVSYGMCPFRHYFSGAATPVAVQTMTELLCWPAVNHSDDGKPPTGLKLQRTVKEEFALKPSWDLFRLTSALLPWRAEGTRSLLTAFLCSLVSHALQRWKVIVNRQLCSPVGQKNTW